MGVACPKCGNEDLMVDPISRFQLGIPHLRNLKQAVVRLSCRPCGSSYQCQILGQNRSSFSHFMAVWDNGKLVAEDIRQGLISLWSSSDGRKAFVDYNFANSGEQGVLWPIEEPKIQTVAGIDKFGDPDLMADFAKEYLKQHWVLIQPGRLPQTLVEVMPSLLLLVTAAELAIKAFKLRSTCIQSTLHDLVKLYDSLDPEHQADIEFRFGRCELVVGLTAIGIDAPKVRDILGRYTNMYGNEHGAYLEAKYYAEPTTMLRKKVPEGLDLKGAILNKGNTPYPTFMPYLVQGIVDCYYHFSGVERLRRRGAEIHEWGRASESHGHGDWSLRPSSLGLAVILVPQNASKDANHNDLPSIASLKSLYPTEFQADWMYGGRTLLFFDAIGKEPRDGIETIAGVECRIISDEQVRMHARDLYRLADRLKAIDAGDTPLGNLPPTQ